MTSIHAWELTFFMMHSFYREPNVAVSNQVVPGYQSLEYTNNNIFIKF